MGLNFESIFSDYLFTVVLVDDNWFKIQRHLPSCGVNVTSQYWSWIIQKMMIGPVAVAHVNSLTDPTNVCSAEKLTKCSSNTVLRLVSFSAEQTLWIINKVKGIIKIFWKKNNVYNNPTHHISSWFYIQDNTKENLISVKPKLWVLNIGVTGVKFLPVCWYENANFFSGIHLKKSIQITNFVIFMTTFSINKYKFLVLGFKRLA